VGLLRSSFALPFLYFAACWMTTFDCICCKLQSLLQAPLVHHFITLVVIELNMVCDGAIEPRMQAT
jgi:hypothetical protein